MKSFLICLIGFIFAVQTSSAIRCHYCYSDEKGNCAISSNNLYGRIEDCKPLAVRTNVTSPITQATEELDSPSVCFKAIYVREKKTVYERGCVRKIHAESICDKAKENTGVDVEDCEICEQDECNTAAKQGQWLPLILIPAVAAIFKLFT